MFQRIYALLESKKFIVFVIIANTIVLGFLVTVLFIMWNNKNNVKFADGEVRTVEYSDKDKELSDIYVSLLAGNEFKTKDGSRYVFINNREYSGYFDADNPEVKGFYYKVLVEENKMMLVLHNKDGTKSVSYEISFNKEGDIELQSSRDKKSVILSFA